jgi:hypothetical protein
MKKELAKVRNGKVSPPEPWYSEEQLKEGLRISLGFYALFSLCPYSFGEVGFLNQYPFPSNLLPFPLEG